MIAWLAMTFAMASDGAAPDAWLGAWGLDPVLSDDPFDILQSAIRAPTLSSGSAGRMSPDGGQADREDAQARLVKTTMSMLGRSGRVAFDTAASGGLVVEFGGEAPIALSSDKKWTRVRRDEGLLRIRAEVGDDYLRVERRIKTMTLVETFLLPKEPDLAYTVVQIDGSGMNGIEFRRVYRALESQQ